MSTKTKRPLAYPGGEEQRSQIIRARLEDVELDRLRAGSYFKRDWEDGEDPKKFQACDIGCLAVSVLGYTAVTGIVGIGYDWHSTLGVELGWPVAYCELRDDFFEMLEAEDRVDWSTRALEAVQVGMDLTGVVDRLLLDILSEDEQVGVQRFAVDRLQLTKEAHRLLARKLDNEEVDKREWEILGGAATTRYLQLLKADQIVADVIAAVAEYGQYGGGAGNVIGPAIELPGISDRDLAERLIQHTIDHGMPVSQGARR